MVAQSLQMPHARMVKLRKEGSPHRFIALWKHTRCSLRTLSFYLIRAQWLISLFLVLRAHWFSASGDKKKQALSQWRGLWRPVPARPSATVVVAAAGGCFIFTPTWLIIRDACRHIFRMLQLSSARKIDRTVRPWYRAEAHHQYGVYSWSTVRKLKARERWSIETQPPTNRKAIFWTACVSTHYSKFFYGFVFFSRAHWFARWTRTRNREINHCALRHKLKDDYEAEQKRPRKTARRTKRACSWTIRRTESLAQI